MKKLNLLKYKHNFFSQNGEDGIVAQIFSIIGQESGVACEFGAWDGVHLSNIRHLILEGWTGIFIEGQKERYLQAVTNYKNNKKVFCINAFVDNDKHSLSKLLGKAGLAKLAQKMDFLTIDIDGLDDQIFQTLDISPRVICIEVNAGHNPLATTSLSTKTAVGNIGQPLEIFNNIARSKHYGLVCYNGNAFYIRDDVIQQYGLPVLSAKAAYQEFITHLSRAEKEWLYLVNLGLVPPYWQYHNPMLNSSALHISPSRVLAIASYTKAKTALFRLIKRALRVPAP